MSKTTIASFAFYTDPFELPRENQWDSSTFVGIGLGQWTGGAIGGTEEAVVYIADSCQNTADAHFTRSELIAFVSQLNEIIAAMGDSQ